MKHNVIVSSSRHTIKTPLKDLHVRDIVEIFDEDTQRKLESVIAINNYTRCSQDTQGKTIPTYVDCYECPLFENKICPYHWEDENGILHSLCESMASLADPNASDIRLSSLGNEDLWI